MASSQSNKRVEAIDITNFLYNEIVIPFGCPTHILTDNGSNFSSSVLDLYVKTLKIKHLMSTPYHPQMERARLLNSAGFTVSRLPPMLISLLLKGVCLSQLQYAFVFLTNSKSSPYNIRLESAFSYCFNLLFRIKTKTSIAVICLLLNTVPVFQRHSLLLRKFQLNFGFHLENETPLGRCIQQQIPDRRLKHIYYDETRSDSTDLIRDSFADFKRQLTRAFAEIC